MLLLTRLPQPSCCNFLVMTCAGCSIVWLNPGLESWSDAEKPRAPLIPSTRRLLATSLARGLHEGERNRPDSISGNGSAVRLRITVRLRRVSAESYLVWEILRQRCQNRKERVDYNALLAKSIKRRVIAGRTL